MSALHRPCPYCGGTDRLYLITQPRAGGTPYWRCRRACGYTERTAGDVPDRIADAHTRSRRSSVDIELVRHAYGVVAERCAATLWKPVGVHALQHLRSRGLDDETIKEAMLGYCPDGAALMAELWRTDLRAYTGAELGGLRRRQARPNRVLQNTITIPYWSDGSCVFLRGRALHPSPGEPKYLSPAGQSYASAEPRFYLHDELRTADCILLTEGELKALAAHQAFRRGEIPMPCIAIPGIDYLPDALILHLRGKTVYLVFDSEAPKPGEHYSPAEAAIRRHAPRLVRQGVQPFVVTLPRPAGVQKVDLDDYLRAGKAV